MTSKNMITLIAALIAASASPVSAQDRSIVDNGLPSYAAPNKDEQRDATPERGADDLLKNAEEVRDEAKRLEQPDATPERGADDLLKNAEEVQYQAKRSALPRR